ncbi:MAG: CARDB domain-containing protein, partial [Candidatus Thermoplasmatota archaeon]|nr:CARDB domain-containing protein [Candidatus Thermoplasmatota archaeon]
IWSRGSNVSWTMVCLGLDPTALQSGSIIPEILAENTVSPGHPPSQVITAEGDLYTCFIHEGSRTGIHLISRERPDLKVQWVGFIDTGHDPVVLENVTLFADVLNLWNANISGLEITFTISLEGSVVFHDGYLTYFLPSAINRRTLNWTPILEGSYTLTVKVDPEDILQERNESNDQLTTVFLVGRQEMDLSVRSGSGVLPDEIGELKITLENRGTVTTTYDLLVKGDVIEWFSKTTTSLEVPPGQERTIIFPYRAPDGTLAGNYMILVTGSSTREKKDPVMVAHDLIILPRYNSSVDFGNYNREIDPGITYTMPITVDNFGNCWIKYTLSGNSSLGAPLRYNGMHLPQTLPPIQSGSSLEVLIEMDVPEGMEPGRSIKVDLSLLNQQAGQTFSASYNMSIMEMPKPGLEIEDENLELDGRWISKLVTVKVRNIGNVRDIFDFEASAQTGDWDARVIDPYSRSVALSPGEEINVTMSIIPPPIPSEGTKMFMFKATPMLRESMNQEISFNIQVGKKFNVTFTQSRIELNTEPGEKHRLMLTYTNTGNQDASFSLIFSGAGSDGLFVEPITGGRMQWNESVPIQIVSGGTNTFWIEVTIPSEMKDNRLKIN